jgi:hypothetical protein
MPMAPEPTTISFFGTSLSTIASRYWMMRSPSICVPGRLRARAPVAMMKLAAVMLCALASGLNSEGVTWSVWLSVKTPCPSMTSILFFFIRKPTPLVWRETMSRLRLTALPKSTLRLSKLKP